MCMVIVPFHQRSALIFIYMLLLLGQTGTAKEKFKTNAVLLNRQHWTEQYFNVMRNRLMQSINNYRQS
jgi:hypothetical protein